MTRRTQSKKKVRTQHTQSYKDEALGLAEKVGVARAAADARLPALRLAAEGCATPLTKRCRAIAIDRDSALEAAIG